MPEYTTSDRLRQIMRERELKQVDILRMTEPYLEKYKLKIGRNDISQYVAGKVVPRQNKLFVLAAALDVSEAWLMGYDVKKERETTVYDKKERKFKTPQISEKFQSYHILGEIAAGYDSLAYEDYGEAAIDIPQSFLKGRDKSDYFVLQVKGDSMYPLYQNGDKVLILKQSVVDYSGQICAVLYNSVYATLKKIEFNEKEDWMKLVPINPEFQPKTIRKDELEQCKIIGIPKMLIRDCD